MGRSSNFNDSTVMLNDSLDAERSLVLTTCAELLGNGAQGPAPNTNVNMNMNIVVNGTMPALLRREGEMGQ